MQLRSLDQRFWLGLFVTSCDLDTHKCSWWEESVKSWGVTILIHRHAGRDISAEQTKAEKERKAEKLKLKSHWIVTGRIESCSSYKRSDFLIILFFANFLEKLQNTGHAENWKAPRVHISQYYIDVHS